MKAKGFTVIELVVVIVLLGILAAVAVPRFFDLNSYRTRAAYDEFAGALRYAQKLAVVSGCGVQVVVSGSGYALQQRTGLPAAGETCATGPFGDVGSDYPVSRNDSIGTTLTAQTFSFDPMGRCSGPVTLTVGGTETINIVAETGYVDAP